jgi:hypothetical protein
VLPRKENKWSKPYNSSTSLAVAETDETYSYILLEFKHLECL